VSFGLTTAVMMSQGRFDRYSAFTVMEGVAITAAGGVGAWLNRDASPRDAACAVAIWSGVQMAVGRIAVVLIELRRAGATVGATARPLVSWWSLGSVAAVAAIAVDRLIGLEGMAGAWFPEWASGPRSPAFWMAVQATRVGLTGALFIGLFVGFARALLPRALADCARFVPSRLATLVRRALLLQGI